MTTRIKVSVGGTLNMGDFNSVRLDVGIEDDKREDESAHEAFERLWNFCEKRFKAKAREQLND